MSCAPGTYWAGYETASSIFTPGSIEYTQAPVCKPCPRGHYQPNKGAIECVACPNGTSTNFEGSNTLDSCKGSAIIFRFLT